MNINELNNWLEEQASGWESWRNEHKQFTDWPEYYRGLKDIDQKDSFTLSSCEFIRGEKSLLYSWVKENASDYNSVGGTGYCEYFKK